MVHQFTWIPIYQELANVLASWEDKQTELIAFLEKLRMEGYVITPLMDSDHIGARFLLQEIDPFTFFGVFNRRIQQDQRISILARMKRHFKLASDPPDDFNGVPILNNMKSWFITNQADRQPGDVEKLWRILRLGLEPGPLESEQFREAFDAALTVKQTNVNLTMGLFWIRPHVFLNLDQTNRSFLEIKLPPGGLNAQFYAETVRSFAGNEKSFPELSLEAWGVQNEQKVIAEAKRPHYRVTQGPNYWLVGAYWDDYDPPDQTERFLAEGIWEIGDDIRLSSAVNAMRVNDKIAIKATSTQRNDLPFDNHGRTVSRMTVKAAGTIVANRNNGKTVEVEWDPKFQAKDWYFYTNRSAIWHLRTDPDSPYRELAERLKEFVWDGKEQDTGWFLDRLGSFQQGEAMNADQLIVVPPPYGIEDLLASGAFLTQGEVKHMLARLRAKKALILQGPPGVGKTFIARKLAYAFLEERDPERVETVQFHQSYSYDDFVRGYRPLAGQPGSFGLQNGVFTEFCQKAIQDPERKYVFIIDEINRGNLSQIFGELLMLIEHDKRGPDFSIPLVYRHGPDESRFYIPQNLYLIGLMNMADRSLAMVDYALRRRFAFVSLGPQYESEMYRSWLGERAMSPGLIDLIVDRMTALNQEIRDDPLLGENYQIGHSFFCPPGDHFAGLDKDWYRSIVRTEIVPLLKEYWFDNPAKAEAAERRLLA